MVTLGTLASLKSKQYCDVVEWDATNEALSEARLYWATHHNGLLAIMLNTLITLLSLTAGLEFEVAVMVTFVVDAGSATSVTLPLASTARIPGWLEVQVTEGSVAVAGVTVAVN